MSELEMNYRDRCKTIAEAMSLALTASGYNQGFDALDVMGRKVEVSHHAAMMIETLLIKIAAAEAKGKAEGVAEGLEKAASWLDNKWTDLDGEYYYEEAASKIRALQSKPVIIDRAGNTWQQVKPCPDCNEEGA